jgi:hypothetical protein
MPKRNREKLMEQSLYDFLLKMQYELELCRQHSETPCIMNALGENLVGLRCTKYNRKCNAFIAEWLNEYPF